MGTKQYTLTLLVFLTCSLGFTQEDEEIGEAIGKEEAPFIYNSYKKNYFEINNLIQPGAQLQRISANMGEEERNKQAEPYLQHWNALNEEIKGYKKNPYKFLRTITQKSLACISCDPNLFNKQCKTLDRGLELLKGVYGPRPGKRIYDTDKYPHEGFKYKKGVPVPCPRTPLL